MHLKLWGMHMEFMQLTGNVCCCAALTLPWRCAGRMKIPTCIPLTSSLHEVHTNSYHPIRAIHSNLSWRMRKSAFFSCTQTSLKLSTDLHENTKANIIIHDNPHTYSNPSKIPSSTQGIFSSMCDTGVIQTAIAGNSVSNTDVLSPINNLYIKI